MSRFLALLSVMRLPTRNAEGIGALVKLLAPHTDTHVTGHWPQSVVLEQPASLAPEHPVRLGDGMPLGAVGHDANSQLRLRLCTEDQDEAREWLPGGRLIADLRVLLEVYLGWRCTALLQLSIPREMVPAPVLGRTRSMLGMTAVLMRTEGVLASAQDDTITINLGRYQGLQPNPCRKEVQHVAYRF
jgi:type VI secretion system protein ImpH